MLKKMKSMYESARFGVMSHGRLWNELEQKLLSISGSEVVHSPETGKDLRKILLRGILVTHPKIRLIRGACSQCHYNAANVWNANRGKVAIVSGYSYSKDGAWRQHTWAFDFVSGKILETTSKRSMYYGYIMNENEAEDFYRSEMNAHPEIVPSNPVIVDKWHHRQRIVRGRR